MQLTKKAKTVLVASIVFILIVAAATAAFFLFNASAGPKQNFTLYFLDSTGSSFSTETRGIEITAQAEHDDAALLSLLTEALIAGPKDSVTNKRAIPPETQLLSLQISDNKIATVDFSEKFYSATDLENNFAVCTVVLTLCETEKVDKVAVHVNGKEIIGQGKVPLGALGKDDIVNASDPSKMQAEKSLLLYYPSRTEDVLLTEERALQLDGGMVNESTALSELIKGTTNPDAVSVIPASVKVLSCETKENICYVNFSGDFVTKKPEGSTSEALLIDSIVYTLTEFENVSKVMFLIEGEKVESYGHLVFNEPFERSVDVIIQ